MQRFMKTHDTEVIDNVQGLAAGAAGTIVLTLISHFFYTGHTADAEYRYTRWLTECVGWPYGAVYLLVSFWLGYALRRAFSIAFGMMSPLPVALGLEIFENATSHNLFPFEIVLTWLPAFIIAVVGSFSGKLIADRYYPR